MKKEESFLLDNIINEISSMAKEDQEMRQRAKTDFSAWNPEVDKRHANRMKEIILTIGWPTRSLVGDDSAHDAWLIAQHADHDVEFQTYCLSLMKDTPRREVDEKNIAYLEDRVRVNSGLPQLYGTQYHLVDGKMTPRPIEDIEHIDERRSQLGLLSMTEQQLIMDSKWSKYKKP